MIASSFRSSSRLISTSSVVTTTTSVSAICSRWWKSSSFSSMTTSSSSRPLQQYVYHYHRTTFSTTPCISSKVLAGYGHGDGEEEMNNDVAREVQKVRQKENNTSKDVVAGETEILQNSLVLNSQFFHNGKPTLAYARLLPKTFATMTNEQILHFGELGVPEACRECIVRDIMMVDGVEYDEAMHVFQKIAKTNREDMSIAALPFYTGVFVSVGAGYVSIPLVFHRGIVEWFNEKFVTAEMPPVEDLETWLEVGSVAWNWMEPVLGQVSFFILCMQMARSQLQNLGIRPYFHWQQERRALKLVRMFPQYDERFLANYSRCDHLSEPRQMSD